MVIKTSDIIRNGPAGRAAVKTPSLVGWDRNPLFFQSFVSDMVVAVSIAAKDPLLWKLRRDPWNAAFRRSKKRAGKSNHHWTKYEWDSKRWLPIGSRANPIPIIAILINRIRK